MEFLFWLSAACLAFTFFGYPLLIGMAARLFGMQSLQPINSPNPPSNVSVVLVVFNGRDRIIARIKNLLAQQHPIQEIIVVCDGCTDGTPEAITSLSDPRVHLISRPARTGKSACLNEGIAQATGEIIVLTDVRQEFEPETISLLVENFSDPEVGAVSGSLEIKSSSNPLGKGVGTYWSFEKKLRNAESSLDSCIGCTGAVYALRRSLFKPIPPDTLLDDVVIPMNVATAGFRVKFDPRAVAYDPQPLDPEKESIRKRRTLAGNFQMLFRQPGWILPWKNRLFFQLICHKYLRLLAPFCLLTFIGSNIALRRQPIYEAFLILQFGFYAFGFLGYFSVFKRWRLFSLPASFIFLNLMVLGGLLDYLSKPQSGAWESSKPAPLG